MSRPDFDDFRGPLGDEEAYIQADYYDDWPDGPDRAEIYQLEQEMRQWARDERRAG